MFDLVYVCSNLNAKGKRTYSVKWVRMGGKIQIYKGCFVKVKNLLLNRKYR
jgi:hypothetical protein